LKSLESVSFSGSELFYLSGQAFYDCQKLKNLDLSNTNVKYIDSCLPIYLGAVSTSLPIPGGGEIQGLTGQRILQSS